MRPHLLLAVAMALPLFVHVQQPDFSGTWIATTAVPQGFPAAPSPVFGARFAIALDGGSLTLTRMSRDGSFPVTMPVGGEPVRVRRQRGSGRRGSARARTTSRLRSDGRPPHRAR